MKNDLQSTILCTYEYTASILYIREHFAQSVCASQVASPTCTLLISLRIYYGCPFVLPIFVWWSLPASTLKTNKALSCGEKCKANSKAYGKPRWKTLRTYAMSCSRQVYTGQRCHEALHTSICACVLLSHSVRSGTMCLRLATSSYPTTPHSQFRPDFCCTVVAMGGPQPCIQPESAYIVDYAHPCSVGTCVPSAT